MTGDLARRSVAIIGAGGLGCPAAIALIESGIGKIVLVDDDSVDESNLHRQILYDDHDIGLSKLQAARRSLMARGAAPEQIELREVRCVPENVRDLLKNVDLVLEGADNFATKFLVADAAHIEQKPVVHGAALRWQATVLGVNGVGSPCYRCLFEDIPRGPGADLNCNQAGVMGPVVGLAGALMADLALRILSGENAFGRIYTYDGKRDRLRSVEVSARLDCALCGSRPDIVQIDEARYVGPLCAA
jgi:adenylyltransferase/sulfurtransferase